MKRIIAVVLVLVCAAGGVAYFATRGAPNGRAPRPRPDFNPGLNIRVEQPAPNRGPAAPLDSLARMPEQEFRSMVAGESAGARSARLQEMDDYLWDQLEQAGQAQRQQRLLSRLAILPFERSARGALLVPLVEAEDLPVRLAAMDLAARRRVKEAAPAVLRRARVTGDESEQERAVSALGYLRVLSDDVREYLYSLVDGGDPRLEALAVKALGDIGDPSVFSFLLERNVGRNWALRTNIMIAMAKIDHPDSAGAIFASILSVPVEKRCRVCVARGVQALGMIRSNHDTARFMLFRLAAEDDEYLRVEALQELRRQALTEEEERTFVDLLSRATGAAERREILRGVRKRYDFFDERNLASLWNAPGTDAGVRLELLIAYRRIRAVGVVPMIIDAYPQAEAVLKAPIIDAVREIDGAANTAFFVSILEEAESDGLMIQAGVSLAETGGLEHIAVINSARDKTSGEPEKYPNFPKLAPYLIKKIRNRRKAGK